ncbi:hypothetical protein V6N11_077907 [Hibiscus sabdariffa]|uniref:Uncharacterized protein n=1 Tax=Hibiscus sabdariffa TaxID=183260 RepID=A0ABR2TEJ5_9ROSI
MDARKTPGLVRCIEDNQPNQLDLEHLALNEDGNINEVIKNHSLVAKECWFDKSLFKRAGKYGPWLRANSKGKKHGGKSSKWENVNINPNYDVVASINDFGQCGQDVAGSSKIKAKSSPLRSEGDGKKVNVNPMLINEEDIAIHKSQEIRDHESTLDTFLQKSLGCLSAESKENFATNGMLEIGAIPVQPKVSICGVNVLGSIASPALMFATLGY